jgi:5-methylcytosine-specific restriction endonuclease McrA
MTERKRGRAGQRDRKRRLARTNGLCEMCMAEGRVELATVVNHKKPLAKGGPDTDENTENLCRAHDLKVTAEQFSHEKQSHLGACDANGMPTDPDHPWNRSS